MIHWYPRLTREHKNGLLSNVTLPKDYLIICRQAGGKDDNDSYRSFAAFSPLYTFGNYILKTPAADRCFYEVIQGDSLQKPYFDIDISDPNVSIKESEELIYDLKRAILLDSRISEPDILVFSSHGETKRSYHVVVNNWCLPDYGSNKVYCHRIISKMIHPAKRFIDHLVYKSIQQFRTYGSTKHDKNRFKILESLCEYEGSVSSGVSSRFVFFSILMASLVTNTGSCRILEYSVPVKKVYNSDLGDLTEEELKILESLDFIQNKTFDLMEPKGRIVPLKRNQASFCDICQRTHEAENPFLVFGEGVIVFHCRRKENDGKIVWRRPLGPLPTLVLFGPHLRPLDLIKAPVDSSSEMNVEQNPEISPTEIDRKKFLKKFLGKK
jgi:hypothetical protein